VDKSKPNSKQQNKEKWLSMVLIDSQYGAIITSSHFSLGPIRPTPPNIKSGQRPIFVKAQSAQEIIFATLS
jgi:hypothetical protein